MHGKLIANFDIVSLLLCDGVFQGFDLLFCVHRLNYRLLPCKDLGTLCSLLGPFLCPKAVLQSRRSVILDVLPNSSCSLWQSVEY